MKFPEWFYSRKVHKSKEIEKGLRDRRISEVFIPIYLDMIYSIRNCSNRVPERLARYFSSHKSQGCLEQEIMNIIDS